MNCGVCGSEKNSVVRTVPANFKGKFSYSVKTRKCLECGTNFKTIELPVECVPEINPATVAAMRQLAQAAKSALRMAEAAELYLIDGKLDE